ncbi:3-ketosteroid-delta-1-dehydrogenase [Mycobacterium saskatchewanense]|uniref:FAD-dependent oxidoreductase 2 FAD-binding domain-containing protein n=1 Tax=Mycobacterium saskatchewanense TaxID=220927 RepID=A0AAJ3NSU7_9MYCO|nr:FAD-dependent oxidoreductase [Mycobacterium saskatchewanense]ORW72924.1 hypothetical protein AWC23_08700 [Mycobacterium saskatchewanense]BBX62547.1 3-ketosteroid-delta-1-dehydrogenase [Mycobacterium saskatchewanense]
MPEQLAPHDQWQEAEWDAVADVVVVGTGIAGGAAAVAAAGSGSSVLVLEKAAGVGGTTALSGGAIWIPDNFALHEHGIEDDRDRLIRYMARSAFPASYIADSPTLGLAAEDYWLIETFFDESAAAVDELVAAGALQLEGFDMPDYYSDLPEAVQWGHALAPKLPPDWRPGGPAGGMLVVQQLLSGSERLGAKILLRHTVIDLLKNTDDEVIGVEARRGRQTRLIGARKGVVFATGGFLHNTRLVADFLRAPVLGGVGAPTATGDFVAIGARAGAQLSAMSQAWWDQVVVELALRNRQTARDVLHVHGDAMVVVNSRAERVLNEKSPYSERGLAHFFWDSGRHEYPNRILFMVFDESVRHTDSRGLPAPAGTRTGRFPVPYPDESPEYLICGETLEDLAANIGTRLAALAPQIGEVRLASDFSARLRQTIERFGQYARAGYDPEFLRGETAIEKAWEVGDSAWPNPAMAPFGGGPYYCILLGPGALDTKGGPRIDAAARVVGWSGQAIPGLFAAGNCAASITGQAYWGPGTTLGQGLTFGYIAGRNAAAEKVRSSALLGTEIQN